MAVAYTAIASADKAAGAPVSTTLINALDNNVQAAFEGTATFKVLTAALDTGERMNTTNVMGIVAADAVGAVGSYALCTHVGADTTISVGENVDGTTLRYAGFGDLGISSGTTPTGTWKCMGYILKGTTGTNATSLFKRVS